VGLLAIHAALLAWSALRASPVRDELGQLPAGISHWKYGRFELYRVNPPLVRMLGALPALAVGCREDWTRFDIHPTVRPEYAVGLDFFRANGDRSLALYRYARWMCIPLSLVGGLVCFRWAGELYGRPSAFLALTLWCFSPNVLGYGALLMTDIAAASFGALACYAFAEWLRAPSYRRALVCGAALGLAELTKTTWIVLPPVWLAIWLAWRIAPRSTVESTWRREAGQLATIFVLGIAVINVGYGFNGSLRPLGDYRFASRALSGHARSDFAGDEQPPELGNRFAGTALAGVPVPLPREYVLGLDVQRRSFERPLWSYLGGDWRKGGWWYYYLYALAVKLPVGTLLLIAAAGLLTALVRRYRVAWRDDLLLLAPAAAVLLVVSSQTAFSQHLRYALPVLPFLFIWASKAGRAWSQGDRAIGALTAAALVWTVMSSLSVYPHTLAYFNELAGGPRGGRLLLAGSNLDWGQDLLELKRWSDEHPQAKPLYMAHDHMLNPSLLGIQCELIRDGQAQAASPEQRNRPLPEGWYAISTNVLTERNGRFAAFTELPPEGMAGYSIYIIDGRRHGQPHGQRATQTARISGAAR